MRDWFGRLAGAVVTTALAVVAALAGAAPVHASVEDTTLPGGRATFVVSIMGGPVNATWARLATYGFSPAGSVTRSSWAWNQASVVGTNQAARLKPSTGYTTAGCLRACPLRTPAGFQPGTRPTVSSGTWTATADEVTVTWPGQVETWRLRQADGAVGARLVSARGGATSGWGVGSDAGADQGVRMAELYRVPRLYGPFLENLYGRPTLHKSLGFHMPDYRLCTSGQCLQGAALTGANKRTWFHSYLASRPASDGRKTFWNMQTGAQQQIEDPKGSCISARGGGHTFAMLQVVDDAGTFRGWVGVEASLSRRAYGQAVVASFATVTPDLLAGIS